MSAMNVNFHRRNLVPRASRLPQRGAATLIVVMILFFVVSLAAAYASRNLIFEQRTSVNQYNSTKSAEAAEAGIEWALSMLNGGRIDENCTPTTDASKDSYRQRYLVYNAPSPAGSLPTGILREKVNSAGDPFVWSACSYDGTSWTCRCPAPDTALAGLPEGIAAFGVRFYRQMDKPGAVRIEVNGCTSANLQCITAVQPNPNTDACRSTACSLLAQFPSIRAIPVAAVTARQGVDGSSLTVYNSDLSSGGFTVHTGGDIATGLRPNLTLGSLPGTPPNRSIRANDSDLLNLENDSATCNLCTFSSVFGLRPGTYRDQPAAVRVDCSTACTSVASTSDIGKALSAGRGVFVASPVGKLSISTLVLTGTGAGAGLSLNGSTSVIGSATEPVTLISEVPVTLANGAKIFGLVYAPSVTLTATAEVQGAVVTAGTLTSNAGQVLYDADILARLQKWNGSFVRVAGSWSDFD